jgi:hypothetical protein
MDHRAYRELAAGAALNDLDAGERSALDAHLAGCGQCRADARELADTAGMLTLAAPRRTPPTSLRRSVMAAIAASENRPVGVPAASLAYAGTTSAPTSATYAPPNGASREPGAPPAGQIAASVVDLDDLRRERSRYRRLSLAGLAAAAVLAIAVGALSATAAGLHGELETATQERDSAVAQLATTDQAMAVVMAPGHTTATLTPDPMASQAAVYVVYVPGSTDAWLMAGNLPATPAGKVYQLWSADGAGVHALTTFTCDGTHACLAPFGVDLAAASATMITLEPAGGSQGEPGPQVAFGELQG